MVWSEDRQEPDVTEDLPNPYEQVTPCRALETCRLQVPGGWLYVTTLILGDDRCSVSTTFVPLPDERLPAGFVPTHGPFDRT